MGPKLVWDVVIKSLGFIDLDSMLCWDPIVGFLNVISDVVPTLNWDPLFLNFILVALGPKLTDSVAGLMACTGPVL